MGGLGPGQEGQSVRGGGVPIKYGPVPFVTARETDFRGSQALGKVSVLFDF